MRDKIIKTDAEWRAQLTPEQYQVTRAHGTERAFTGALDKHYEDGTYRCVCCDEPLFSSDTKFNSGSGWPSFYEAIDQSALELIPDHSHMMIRTEVKCAQCSAHLGHVFEDGPPPTNLRFCINGSALKFKKG